VRSASTRVAKAQKSNSCHPCRLLRACGKRQRQCHGRAAEKRDEIATFQLIELHSISMSQCRI
jgi:hypothetical protein